LSLIQGLGPDEMIMDSWPEGNEAAKWLNHVEGWEAAGRPGGIPPGVGEVLAEGPGNRDYQPRRPGYLLRPEVRVLHTMLHYLGS
jgi:mannosyl-oligosaccharide alpha-1,2-mannosidase